MHRERVLLTRSGKTKASLLEEVKVLRARLAEQERICASLKELIKEVPPAPASVNKELRFDIAGKEPLQVDAFALLENLQQAYAELQVAEEELRQQNEELSEAQQMAEREALRYQELFQAAPDAYLVTDSYGVLREVNHLAEILLNVPRESLIGKPLLRFIDQGQRGEFIRNFYQFKKTSKGRWELRMRPLHQPPFYAEITAALAPGLSVDDERIRWSIRDVTERKQAEEMLRQSEETFRAIGELNPFGVWECDAEGGILYLSQSWLDMTGKSLEESKQFGWMERYAPGEGEKMLEAWRRTLKSGERWEYEHHIIDKNGKDRWVLCRGFPMRDRQGQIARWIGLNIDITQQKRAALELRELNKTLDRRVAERTADLFESETRYKSLFEAIDEGFCVIEVIFDENGKPPDYRFLKTNPAFVKHTGLQDAVGKRMREIEPRHERHWFETYGRVAMTGAPERFVNEARYLGGRWYDGYAFRIGRPEERKVAVLFNDITERKRTREALAESEIRFRNLSESLAETVREKTAELLQVEHLAAVGMMVATVAHEIRNPVQVIRSGVDFLRVASPHDEKARQELIAEIEYGAERVEGTLLDLLAYARPVDLKLSSVTVGGSVEGGLKLVTGKLKAINTTVELENPDEKIQVDFQKFTQVLGNILSNAADAMPNSGNLTIQSRAAKRDEEKFLEISITDTGSGIDEKHLGKIFKPFYTTKTRGTGLGLSLSKRIMDAHGGNMSITSKMGVGTTVVLRIPLRKSSSP